MSNDLAESNALAAFIALIEREVERRVRPLEETLQSFAGNVRAQTRSAEEYLSVEQLAERLHASPKTVRDWVHKRKIPVIKLPTGGLLFPWSEIEAWMRGEKS